jgi:hypothetical protein
LIKNRNPLFLQPAFDKDVMLQASHMIVNQRVVGSGSGKKLEHIPP